jgi:hypothetical protein
MLAGLLKFVAIWLTIDAVIIAVGWYFATNIKPHYSDWWQQVIADRDPTD